MKPILRRRPPSVRGTCPRPRGCSPWIDLHLGALTRRALRGLVNNEEGRLDPTPHSFFVAQVLFAELPFQVALLAFDDPTLDYQQHYRQKTDGPQRVRQAGYAGVDQRHGQVTGVAGVTERSLPGYALDRLVGAGRRVGLAHGPFEPAQEHHPPAEQRPSEAARHRAWKEAHREPPAHQQAEDE